MTTTKTDQPGTEAAEPLNEPVDMRFVRADLRDIYEALDAGVAVRDKLRDLVALLYRCGLFGGTSDLRADIRNQWKM